MTTRTREPLADYHERIKSEPLTPNMLGRIHAEFIRLGFDEVHDRARRLAMTAVLAGYDGDLATTKDLSYGQAGQTVGALRFCRTRGDLPAIQISAAEPADLIDYPVLRSGMREKELVRHITEMTDTLGLVACHLPHYCRTLPGFPDFVIIGRRRTIWRECKSRYGDVSPAQRIYGERLRESGEDYAIWRPADLITRRIENELRYISGAI